MTPQHQHNSQPTLPPASVIEIVAAALLTDKLSAATLLALRLLTSSPRVRLTKLVVANP